MNTDPAHEHGTRPAAGSWWLSIDFGTSNTAAAVMGADGVIQPARLEAGSTTMPSAVVWMGDGYRVGQAAENARIGHAADFEPSPKTLLGGDDAILMGGVPVSAERLVAEVLRVAGRAAARMFDGTAPSRIWLTHPAEWGPRRVGALRAAAGYAGFDPATLTLVPEPLAALAHYVRTSASAMRSGGNRIAVFDFGGGTCDIAVIHTNGSADLRVTALVGDDMLGGNALDDLLLAGVEAELAASGNAEMIADLRRPEHLAAALTLRRTVRDHKEELSDHAYTDVPIAVAGRQAVVTVTADDYEMQIADRMRDAERLVSRALAVSGPIDAIYLIGGASRTRPVAVMLERATGVRPTSAGNPKLVVAEGAFMVSDAALTAYHRAGEADGVQPVARTEPTDPRGSESTRPVSTPPENTSPANTPPATTPLATTPSETTPSAGWHPDPSHPGMLRWWDGVAWTGAQQPMPRGSRADARSETHQPEVQRPQTKIDPVLGAGGPATGPVTASGGARAWYRRPAATVSIAAVALVAVIGIVIAVSLPRGGATGPTDPPPEADCWDGSTVAVGDACPALTGADALLWTFDLDDSTVCERPTASYEPAGAVEVLVCTNADYPGGYVYLAEWPDVASASEGWDGYFPADSVFKTTLSPDETAAAEQWQGAFYEGGEAVNVAEVFLYGEVPFSIELGVWPAEGGTSDVLAEMVASVRFRSAAEVADALAAQ